MDRSQDPASSAGASGEVALEDLKEGPVPQHVAVIMDGNGRWAQDRGLPREAGHRAGITPIRKTVEAAAEVDVEVLTLYAFSTENWGRPQREVATLMRLLDELLTSEIAKLAEQDIRLRIIGDTSPLPRNINDKLEQALSNTSSNERLTLNLALNYGARSDILRAVQKLSAKARAGELAPREITEELFSAHLSTSGIPDPDLLIRTSGEKRVSNFLLWELAYTEFWFTPVYWPDFSRQHLFRALKDYQQRDRRYGEL